VNIECDMIGKYVAANVGAAFRRPD
jgi:riboflavin synthase alpha subunit